MRHLTIASLVALAALLGCRNSAAPPTSTTTQPTADRSANVTSDKDDWTRKLTPEQYLVTQQCGTEPPFTGKYWNHHGDGVYKCVCCEAVLFDSRTKFESGSGWPSFWRPAEDEQIAEKQDHSLGMARTEVRCSHCGAHLGHVFDDGPPPTGMRYCINSAALVFEPRKAGEAETPETSPAE